MKEKIKITAGPQNKLRRIKKKVKFKTIFGDFENTIKNTNLNVTSMLPFNL